MFLHEAKAYANKMARHWRQPMNVVQKSGTYYAASDMDMRRQFAGLVPVYTARPSNRK